MRTLKTIGGERVDGFSGNPRSEKKTRCTVSSPFSGGGGGGGLEGMGAGRGCEGSGVGWVEL